MSHAGLSIVTKPLEGLPGRPRPMDFRAIPPRLITREDTPGRTKIWEFSTNLHCSIVGTCLSTTELRQVLRKFGLARESQSDHELHTLAVGLAGRRDDASRQLNKALDHRHKLAVSQFARAGSEDAVRVLWRDAVRRGDIPGAYWATLTHPHATPAMVREAFGDVHMLSHLVGSANRADIKRLCVMEAEKAELEAKLERQQHALHQAVVTRDARIAALRQALADKIANEPAGEAGDDTALRDLLGDLERRLSAETRRRKAVENTLAGSLAEVSRERDARVNAERERDTLRRELDVIEASWLPPAAGEQPAQRPGIHLNGLTVLYVGGRPNQIGPMRMAAERLGAVLLHHDGGIENHPNLLPGLASRSAVVMFPVDCISHDAANAVKAICRQRGKRYIPLRSASVTSLLAALQAPELAAAG